MGRVERTRSNIFGKCPDLITGIHGDDPVKLYSELDEAANAEKSPTTD